MRVVRRSREDFFEFISPDLEAKEGDVVLQNSILTRNPIRRKYTNFTIS